MVRRAPLPPAPGLRVDRPVERELDDKARVDDQHAQWPSRERRTAATTLGIGSPVSVSPQPSGSGAISSSPDSSTPPFLPREARISTIGPTPEPARPSQ